VIVVTSQFDMGEGQVPKNARRGIRSMFSTASNGIHFSGGAPASGGIVDREEGYVK